MSLHYDLDPEQESTKAVISGLPGRTLAMLLSEEPGTLDQLLPIFLQTLRLLDSMHSSGLHHHRIMPTSVRLDENGRPSIHMRSETTVDHQTMAVIDPKYVLPESFWEGTEDGPCSISDSYLLGFIFYELLLGRRRFKAQFAAVESGPASAWLSWHADRSRKIIPLAELFPNFPVSLSQLMREMTEKDPLHRTSDFQSIVRRLESAGEGTASINSLSAGDDAISTDVSAQAQWPEGKGGQKRLFSIGEMRKRKRGKDNECPAKLDQFLQRVEERRAAADQIAERAFDYEKNGEIAEALKQWASVRDVYPNFPDLKAHLNRLRGLLPEGPEQTKQIAQMSRLADGSLHSKRAVFEHVFTEDRKRQPQFRAKRAAWAAVFSLAAASLALWAYYWRNAPVSSSRQVPVELQANVSKAEFTVDGKRVLSASVNLTPGSHQAEAGAEGYEPASRVFTVSEGASNTVLFSLQSSLPSLHFRTPIRGLKYKLDGDDPAELENGVLAEEHMVSGNHTLQILKDSKQIFSLEFQTAPYKIAEVGTHMASPNMSALILSSSKDSAKLYATPDWKTTFGDGSSHATDANGLDLSPQWIAKTEATAESTDGEITKLGPGQFKTPTLNILLKSLPEKVPVMLLANVSDPSVVVNGRSSDLHLERGRGVLWLVPGAYKLQLTHHDYHDSAEEEINAQSSPGNPLRIRFSLVPLRQDPVLVLSQGLSDAEFQIDGKAVTPNKVKSKLTLPLQTGHHVITVKKKNFEEYSLARDFAAGESVDLNTTDMRMSAPISVKASPSSAALSYQQQNGDSAVQISNGTTMALGTEEHAARVPASDFESAKQKVTAESGKPAIPTLTLLPTAKASMEKPAAPSFPSLFSTTDDWRNNAEGWWIHNNPGYAFLERNQGSFLLAVRRRPERGFFNRNKKVTFVVNYKGENDCILYSLDGHTLYRKVFPEGSSQSEYRKRHDAWGEAYILRIAITPEKVILQDREGNILDSLPLVSGSSLGKIGFLGPVALKPEPPQDMDK